MEKSDHRDRRLLRARRPRHRRAAEQRDELATLQSIELHLLPQPGTSWAAYRIGHDQVRGLPQCRISTRPMSESGVRRDKAALSSGCKSRPATAPAGSNRSSYGGNEVAEAFG